MNRLFGKCLALSFILTLSSASFARTPSTGGAEPSLKITVRVYNYAEVSRRTLAQAERKATRVFRQVGVETVWLDCSLAGAEVARDPECQQPIGPTDLVLRIIPRSMATRVPFSKAAFGFALRSTDGRPSYIASLFYHRVEELAEDYGFSRTLVLGHVAAHEIGHLLLNSIVHSASGIMQARWGPKDLKRASHQMLHFTPSQAVLIRTEVAKRMRARKASL